VGANIHNKSETKKYPQQLKAFGDAKRLAVDTHAFFQSVSSNRRRDFTVRPLTADHQPESAKNCLSALV